MNWKRIKSAVSADITFQEIEKIYENITFLRDNSCQLGFRCSVIEPYKYKKTCCPPFKFFYSFNSHGDTVTWTNYDVIPHTVTSGTGPSDPNKGKEFDSGLSTPLMPGKTVTHKFTTAGEFPYYCQLRPAMTGKV